MVIGLSNNNRPCHLSTCQCAVTMYSRGLRRGMGRMAAIAHQPHPFQESLRAQGPLEVRVWKVSNKFSLFRSLSFCWGQGSQETALSPVTLACKLIPAPGSRADGSRGRNGEAGEESITSFQEHRVLVERGSILIIKHTESTLKTKN